MNKRALYRRFIIGVLDDDEGISDASFQTLTQMNIQFDRMADDIIAAIKTTDGRYYLKHEVAEELLRSRL